MAKSREQELILLKYAFTFSTLLELNNVSEIEDNPESKVEKKVKTEKGKKKPITQLGQLSADTEFRPATLSAIFLGRSDLKATTIILILKSLERSYTEFAEIFDNIPEKDFSEFKSKISALKKLRGRPKKKKNKKR